MQSTGSNTASVSRPEGTGLSARQSKKSDEPRARYALGITPAAPRLRTQDLKLVAFLKPAVQFVRSPTVASNARARSRGQANEPTTFPLITVWLEVRILPGPPGSPRFAEISRRLANSPELAGFRAAARSLQSANWISVPVSVLLSLGLEITFPGNGDRRPQRLGSNGRREH